MDQIDPSLDLNTLHITGSSHPVNTIIYPDRSAQFNFHNILLPDSGTDYLGSQGFIQYRIRPSSTISLPAQVNNQAAIYFDFNAPVLTNTVFNTLVMQIPTGVPQAALESPDNFVFPNPFSHDAEIELGDLFVNHSELQIRNAWGQLILIKPVESRRT